MKDFVPETVTDEIWTIAQAADKFNVSENRARRVIAGASLTPIRTRTGVGYLSEEVSALFAARKNSRPGGWL